MKYGYKIFRYLSMENLMNLCIQRDWYTCGDIKEYSHLLSYTKKIDLTADDIVVMALDIISHSDLDDDDLRMVCDDILEVTRSIMVNA